MATGRRTPQLKRPIAGPLRGPGLPLALLLCALVALLGCDNTASSSSAKQSKPATSRAGQPRIVSLSPAISRTLVDFELQSFIVGRTPFCESIDRDIPVVGELITIDYERLVRLKPTHILVQPPATGIDARLVELAAEHDWRVHQWRLSSVEDVETLIRELPAALFESDPERLEEAARRSAELMNQMAAALSPGAEPIFAEPVLMVNSVDPVMAFGEDTYLHDVLRALGGSNATTARGWAQLSLEDVTRLDPAAIIIVQPGAAEGAAIEEVAGALARMDVRAVRDERLAVLRHANAFLPSSGVIGVAAELRAILQRLAAEGSD